MSPSILSSNASPINIGTHSLALYAHGPEPNNSNEPVILFISGVASSSLNWAAVPTAENIALELSLLVKNAPIENPLIIVGHSWAGVLISEFIALTGIGRHIAGLVLVDANHEIAPLVLDVNDPNLLAIAEGVDFYSGIGVAAEHKLMQEEWDAFQSDESTEKYKLIAHKEDEEQYALSFETLRKKELNKQHPLLGDKPVYVIGSFRSRDWTGLYKAGVERGNGTEEQRGHVRELIRTADQKSESLMKEWLKISTKSKLVYARESGHFIQLTQPDVVVHGVKYVLDNIQTC
uniref:Holliday junction ATP-dependent DNA helicase RuvA n=1 Tax=Talaromyces marneffei PM1 TaxID=1077442 RepID=A0A093VJY5_TALMA